jgi:hypothetical protein
VAAKYGVAGSLVGAGGELAGRLQVGIAGGAVGGGVVLEAEQKGEHRMIGLAIVEPHHGQLTTEDADPDSTRFVHDIRLSH